MQLEKAQLYSLDGDEYNFDFMFNPNELSITRKANVNENQGARTTKGLPKVSFAYPNAAIIKISNIIIDTYEKPEKNGRNSTQGQQQPRERDVGNEIAKLTRTIKFVSNQSLNRPPLYVFRWGKINYLNCYVESLDYKLSLFLPDGTPVRATASITLKEVDPNLEEQNPPPNSRLRDIDTRW